MRGLGGDGYQKTEMRALPEQWAAKGAELSKLSTKHVELTEELSSVKSQSAAESTSFDDLRSVAGARELPTKRA